MPSGCGRNKPQFILSYLFKGEPGPKPLKQAGVQPFHVAKCRWSSIESSFIIRFKNLIFDLMSWTLLME